jgi:hypothetical protein
LTIEPFRAQSSTHLIKTISEEKAELKVKGPKEEKAELKVKGPKVKMTSKIDGNLNFIQKKLILMFNLFLFIDDQFF